MYILFYFLSLTLVVPHSKRLGKIYLIGDMLVKPKVNGHIIKTLMLETFVLDINVRNKPESKNFGKL